MAWIESHQHLEKNGKVLELSNMLGINKYQAIGHLHALWWWALDNAEDGDLKRFSNATVTQACGWENYIKDEIGLSRVNEITNRDKGDCFVDALISCGFIDKRDGGLFIHNWDIYTHRYFESVSKSIRSRMMTRERVKRFRERNENVTSLKRDVTPPTRPNPTIPKDKEVSSKIKQAEKKNPFDEINAAGSPRGDFLSKVNHDTQSGRIAPPRASQTPSHANGEGVANPTPDHVMALWNEMIHPDIPKVEMMTKDREQRLLELLRANGEKKFWVDLFERINKSPMLIGKNDRGWTCSFDWILNSKNLVKVLEGNYDNKRRN